MRDRQPRGGRRGLARGESRVSIAGAPSPPCRSSLGGPSGPGGEGLHLLLMDGRDKSPRKSPPPPSRGRLARLLRPLRGRSGPGRRPKPFRPRKVRAAGQGRSLEGAEPAAPRPASSPLPPECGAGCVSPRERAGAARPGAERCRPPPRARPRAAPPCEPPGPGAARTRLPRRLTCPRRWPSWSRCWRRRRPPGRSFGSGSRPARSTRRCARRR